MIYKLEDVAEFQKGFAFKSKDFVEDGTKIVKVSNLTANSIDEEGCVCINEDLADKYKKYELKENDIIITTVGSWKTNPDSVVGKVVMVPKSMEGSLLNQNAVRVRSNDISHQNYLYYLLRNNEFRGYIIGTAQGSANQASITQKDIKQFEHDFPTIDTQKNVGNFLSLFDKTIANNNQINKKIEEINQTIFKHWFIDFEFPNEEGKPYKSSGGEMVEGTLGIMPREWEIGGINEIAKLVGENTKKSEFKASIVPYIGLEHMPRGSIALNIWETSDKITSTKTKFRDGDILFGKLRPYFKKVGIAPISGVCSTDIMVINSQKKEFYSYLLCVLTQEKFIEYCTATATGTRMPRTGWKQISNYKIFIPDIELIEKFNNVMSGNFELIQNNVIENEILEKLRDTLIPKLLSERATSTVQ